MLSSPGAPISLKHRRDEKNPNCPAINAARAESTVLSCRNVQKQLQYGRKAGGKERQPEAGLAYYQMNTHVPEAAGVTKDRVGSTNHKDDHG